MAKKLNILHIIKTLHLGGAETNLLNLLREMDSNKINSHAAYSYGGELETVFLAEKVRLFKYAEKNHKVKSFASLGIALRLCKYIKDNDIDIVHTHNFSAHIWGAMAAKLTGRKILEHVHDFRYLDPKDYEMRRGENKQYRFIKFFKGVSDQIVVLTQQNMNFLKERKINVPKNIKIIRNGINCADIKILDEKSKVQLFKKFSMPKNAFVIFTPIRMAPEKNVDLIIRVAEKVIKKHPNIIFLIAGDGPLFAELNEMIKHKGLESNIKMIGFYQNIKELLSIADIFLLPSFLELHSIAILEAMSQEVPLVVSANTGSNNDFIVDGENGYLLDPFKDDGWADVLLKLYNDEKLRNTMGANGYNTCKNQFNVKDIAQKFQAVYKEMLV